MIEIKEVKAKEAWEKFVLSDPMGNFLQSWNYGRFQESLGKKIFRLGFYDRGQITGTAFFFKQEAKRGTYLECAGGPLINWKKPVYWEEFVKKIEEVGKEEKCVFIRIRPQLLGSLANRLLFKNKGFVPAPMHLHAENTLQLDLGKSEDQLLRGMRKNTRYLIKKAREQGVKVEQSTNLEDIKILSDLQKETVKRQHFIPFSEKVFQQEFKAFLVDDQIRFFKASYEGEALAAALIIFYGREAVYHYSGSSSRFRKIPTSYLLQWEAIKQAKKRGCKVYNLWGVAPEDKPNHRFAGVSIFKRGFGGEPIDYLHAHDFPLTSRYWLIYVFEALRRYFRRL